MSRRRLSQNATVDAGKVGALGHSRGDIQLLGLLGQKFSDKRLKTVRHTGGCKISVGRSEYVLAEARHAYRCPATP